MTKHHEPGRLLVVDDNRVNRLLLIHGLEQQGHTVEWAENGRQALDMLTSRPFDLVLLDIEMPVMNGFQVLEALLADPYLRDLPVIMTSASDELDRVVKCIEMGAEDYLTKPLNPVLLRARVNASLEKKRLRDQQRKLLRTFAIPEVVDELMRTGLTLGGKHVNATVMFADIRSFTSIAESQDPADTINLLNDYFALMFDAIATYGGTPSQMAGDGLMAVFGAPVVHQDHGERAVRAALEMMENLAAFNVQQSTLGKPSIRIGIGIASGAMVAGYIGTQERAVYTCIGDTVNQAARMEQYTKESGCPILVDRNTLDTLPPDIPVKPLGKMLFKGKQQPVDIFSVIVPG
jgi:class 3 adenylate cyclase